MSSSVISAKGESAPGSCTFFSSASKMWFSSSLAFFTRSRTRPRLDLRVEDDDEDDAVADELDVDVRLLALVELGGELVLLEELRHAARRGDVAGGERRERRRVEVVDVAARGDELTVLVDDEDDLGVRVLDEAVHDRSGSG